MIDADELASAVAACVAGRHPDGLIVVAGGAVECRWGGAADVRVEVEGLEVEGELATAAGVEVVRWLRGRGEVDVETDGTVLTLVDGRDRLEVACGPPPGAMGARQWDSAGMVPVGIGLDVVASAVFAASTDTTRPILCGAMVDTRGALVTDSYRLVALDAEDDDRPSAIIPARFIALAAKHCPGGELEVDGREVRVSAGRVRMVGRLTEGDAPDGRRLIPDAEQAAVRVTVPAGELAAAVRSMPAGDWPVELRCRATGGTHAETGRRIAEIEVAVIRSGERRVGATAVVGHVEMDGLDEFDCGLNPQYLAEMLGWAVSQGDERPTIEAVDALKPLVVRTSLDGVEATQLLMPVRTSR